MPRHPDMPCTICARLLWRGSTSSPTPVCRPCRAAQPKQPPKPRTYNGECSTNGCQRGVLGRGLCSSHYSTWHRAQQGHTVTCRECGETKPAIGPRQQFCSRACGSRYKFKAAARSQRKTQAVVVYTRPRHTQPVVIHTKGIGRFTSGKCRVCQAWFTIKNQGQTCSIQCQEALRVQRSYVLRDRRRARKRDAYRADVYRAKVFTSDGYRCHLCGNKTDPTKPVPHPKAPTIDHVIPLASGGTHEPANCRTACFLCNVTKGDRGGGEQLLLLAI